MSTSTFKCSLQVRHTPLHCVKLITPLPPTALLPPVVESPVARTFTEGETARVVCTDPNPPQLMTELKWLDAHGNRAPVNGRILSLPNITRTQAGQYHCVLTAITNDTVSTTLTITVQCEYMPRLQDLPMPLPLPPSPYRQS